VINIPFIANLYKNAKYHNILAGIITIDLIAFISYVIFPSGLFYFGDLQMLIGCIIGIRFSLKHIKPSQFYLTHGIIIGLFGALFSAFSMMIFDLITFVDINESSLADLIVYIGLFLIEGLIVGLITGLIVGGYFNHKYKEKVEQSSAEEEFYKSLELN
jgi:hypothetical protein